MNRPTKYEITNHFTNGFAQSIYELKGGTTVCINYDQTELEMLQVNTIEQRVIQWSLSDDTGISSKTLCAFMLGMNQTNGCRGWGASYPPSDASDRGRCIRLLKLIPEWVPRLPELAKANPGGNWNPEKPNTPVKSSWAYQIPLILAEGNL